MSASTNGALAGHDAVARSAARVAGDAANIAGETTSPEAHPNPLSLRAGTTPFQWNWTRSFPKRTESTPSTPLEVTVMNMSRAFGFSQSRHHLLATPSEATLPEVLLHQERDVGCESLGGKPLAARSGEQHRFDPLQQSRASKLRANHFRRQTTQCCENPIRRRAADASSCHKGLQYVG